MTPSRRRAAALACFVLSLIALGWNVQNAGVASGSIDTVLKLGAQDESLYTREAIHMVTTNQWSTQNWLDRYEMSKPPLLMWLSALSMKLLGINAFAARVPSLVSGALACTLIFLLAWQIRSLAAAIAAAILMLATQPFHILARLNLTDMLLTACVTAALYFALRGGAGGFAVSIALAILAKSLMGFLPVLALFGTWGRKSKFPVKTLAWIVVIAAPWFLYQFVVHREWLMAHYAGVLVMGLGQTPQAAQEWELWFYAKRAALNAPLLTATLLTAIPSWMMALRRRDPVARALLAWTAVFLIGLLLYRHRSVQYMLPLIPVLSLAAAFYSPLMSLRSAWIVCALFAIAFFFEAANPGTTWGLSYESGTTLSPAPLLTQYCEMHRHTDLILLNVDDEFYSSVLPLARVRYAWVDPSDVDARLEPYFRYLGISLRLGQFLGLPSDQSPFRQRLLDWKAPSDRAIGQALVARDLDDLRMLVRGRSQSDYLLPRSLLAKLDPSTVAAYDLVSALAPDVLLLSKNPAENQAAPQPGWSCRI